MSTACAPAALPHSRSSRKSPPMTARLGCTLSWSQMCSKGAGDGLHGVKSRVTVKWMACLADILSTKWSTACCPLRVSSAHGTPSSARNPSSSSACGCSSTAPSAATSSSTTTCMARSRLLASQPAMLLRMSSVGASPIRCFMRLKSIACGIVSVPSRSNTTASATFKDAVDMERVACGATTRSERCMNVALIIAFCYRRRIDSIRDRSDGDSARSGHGMEGCRDRMRVAVRDAGVRGVAGPKSWGQARERCSRAPLTWLLASGAQWR